MLFYNLLYYRIHVCARMRRIHTKLTFQEMGTKCSWRLSTWEQFVLVCLFGDTGESFDLLHNRSQLTTINLFLIDHISKLWVVKSFSFLIWTSHTFCGNYGDPHRLWKRFSCVTALLGKDKNTTILSFVHKIYTFFVYLCHQTPQNYKIAEW